MTLLFFSTDATEVQLADRECHSAGIASEIRHSPLLCVEPIERAETELWVQNDRDLHRAMMLCVQLGVGFSRRPNPEDQVVAEMDCAQRLDDSQLSALNSQLSSDLAEAA